MDNLQKKKTSNQAVLFESDLPGRIIWKKTKCSTELSTSQQADQCPRSGIFAKKANYDDGEKRTDHDIDDHNDHDFDDHDDQDAHDDKTNPGQMCCFTGWH